MINKKILMPLLFTLCQSVFAQTQNNKITNNEKKEVYFDLIGSLGYANYSITNSNSNPVGFNINTSLLKSLAQFNDLSSFVIGPILKYEQVQLSQKVSSSIFNFNEKKTFSTLQLGGEAGVKITPGPFLLYETVRASYGVYNSLSAKITDGGLLIPNQTATATVSNSWNAGFNSRILYPINEKVSLGAEFFVGYGTYQYDSSTVQTAFGPSNTNPGSEYFVITNAGIVGALSF